MATCHASERRTGTDGTNVSAAVEAREAHLLLPVSLSGRGMDVLLDRSGRSAFRSTREYDLHAGDVTALSFSGDGNELTASGLSGKVVALGPRRGGTVRSGILAGTIRSTHA